MFRECTKKPDWFVNKVEIKETPLGLGCFATEDIAKNELFESAPVLIFKRDILDEYFEENQVTHIIHDRVFVWPDGYYCLGLGFCSIYNHSNTPNARHKRCTGKKPSIKFYATRDIKKGEEICHHYAPKMGDLTFDNAGSLLPADF